MKNDEDVKSQNCVDCILDLDGKYVVLIKRANDPFKGYWALPGGRLHVNETLDNAVIREIKEETGLQAEVVSNEPPYKIKMLDEITKLNQVHTYNAGKDPRGGNTTVYGISLQHDPKTLEAKLRAGDDAQDIGVFKINELPNLAFDHFTFIKDYFKKFKKYENPIPTTDILIEYNDGVKEGIVLAERKNPPYGIAIPGGYAEFGLTYEENAIKEAKEETHLNVKLQNPNRPWVYSNPNRDPRGHMVSNTYIANVIDGKLKGDDDVKNAKVYTLNEIKSMLGQKIFAFDHEEILKDYLTYKGAL